MIKALKQLENEPPSGDIRKLTNKDYYRLRAGNYRVLFLIKNSVIVVIEIVLRGQAYKGGK